MPAVTVGLVGNPNCGKTTVFNGLTGARQQVGNWPGVTVERKSGRFHHEGQDVTVVDLPGVYSLGVHDETSLDERVAREYILSGDADLIVDIVDASNLERNLYLTAQLIEMRVPMILAVNMMDVAAENRVEIDLDGIARKLGCRVVALTASRGQGIEALRGVIVEAAAGHRVPPVEIGFDAEVEQAIVDLMPRLAAIAEARRLDARWLAIKLLEGDAGAEAIAGAEVAQAVAECQAQVAARSGEDLDILIADSRFGFAHALMQDTVRRRGMIGRTLSDRIDQVVLHRLLGIPIFLAVMYLLFLFTINVGSAFIDVFDGVTGALLVDGLGQLMTMAGSPDWLIVLLAGGVGGGVRTVASFVPIIACLYLFLSFLEDSGYMARAAFVMDRMMRSVGLPGKSFIPLIVGFGCNVPAIMATRTLENRRDRVMTVMMAPFMSCGARLPVYALFVAAFFPTGGQNVVFALYLIGIGFALLTGLALKTTLLRGEGSPFLMELPPYHLPTLKSILLRTWDRLKSFTFRAGRVIVAVFVVLHLLSAVGTDGSTRDVAPDESLLASAGQAITPALAPMGVRQDNWPATVGMLSGIFAKEAVVGTLSALYGRLAGDTDEEGGSEGWVLVGDNLRAALASVPENLAELANAITDPLGFAIVGEEAGGQDVQAGAFGEMAARFDGAIGAFAYLLAVLLYIPCMAALAAIYRETGLEWAIFAGLWTTGLGYGAAVITYQAGTFAAHPAASAAWIAGILAALAVTLAAFRWFGLRRDAGVPATAAAE